VSDPFWSGGFLGIQRSGWVLGAGLEVELHYSNPKNFHYFVAEVVDDFDGDAAVEGGGEGPGYGSVKGRPGVAVDLGLQGRFQGGVRVVLAQKIGVADEKALAVVVGVQKPAGNPLRPVAPHLPSRRLEDVDPQYLHLIIAVR
jgi:hypothetical protein